MSALDRSSQIFKKLLAFNGSLLFAMSLQRFVLFLVVVRHWLFGADSGTVAASFFAGFRFDLCVVGFINIPVLLITWAISTERMNPAPHRFLQYFRQWSLWIYLGVGTFLIHIFGMLDMMYFTANGRRWTYYEWKESGFSFISQVAEKWGALFTTMVITFFITLWCFRCLFYLYRLHLHNFTNENSKLSKSPLAMSFFGVVLPILGVAMAARGTWTAHHINIEHAQVSQNQALVHMALSPIWAFDKKF